jgi:hypothetical protein
MLARAQGLCHASTPTLLDRTIPPQGSKPEASFGQATRSIPPFPIFVGEELDGCVLRNPVVV